MQEVRDTVKRNVDCSHLAGGFVFTQVHYIRPDVPAENIVAVYQTVCEA